MAGGPINGAAHASFVPDQASVIVPTVLEISNDMLRSITNMTCLYDRYWYPDQNVLTMPICFFYVLDQKEIMQTEVSDQRVILYEPQDTSVEAAQQKLSDSLRPGVQEVISDNVMIKPKSYELTVVLPFQQMSKQFIRHIGEMREIVAAMVEIFGGVSGVGTAFASMTNFPLFDVAARVIDIGSKLPNTDSAAYINKNSLEAMWRSRRLLTMKMWNGYEYKFVMITGITVQKKGTERNVFRATIQVREYPVLSATPVIIRNTQAIDRNWAATAIEVGNLPFTLAVKQLTGVGQASGEGV